MNQPRGRILRLLAVAIAVLALTSAYLVMLGRFRVSEQPGERHFAAEGAGEPAGEVYLEPLSIDAPNDALQMRAYLTPRSAASPDAHGAPARNLTALITHDKTVEEMKLAAGDHVATSTFEVDLNEGSVSRYPLDSYVAQFGVALMDGKSSQNLPVQVTIWEGVLGYRLNTTAEPAGEPDDVQLTLAIARSGAFALFAFCAYGAMVALALCALVIGALTFAGVRRAEMSQIGSLAAMAFALPVLRDALPGRPPLGVQADMWVFLWTELVVVLALALAVFQWARTGPSP
ncbi:MAG TPA: DUF4436 family protein [Roseiarcus sp.]